MNKEGTSHGSGLAVFSILILAVAFIIIMYFDNYFLASIVAVLAAILAAASYIESRRANGPVKFTLTTLIITIVGALFILIWTGTVSRPGENENEPFFREEMPTQEEIINRREKMDELEEKAEELEEEDTSNVR